MSTRDADEQPLAPGAADLESHLVEAHRQLIDRDNAFRFHDEEVARRDLQIDELRAEVTGLQVWAGELERGAASLQATIEEMDATIRERDATIQEMAATTAWRVAKRLRALRQAPRRVLRRESRP